MKNFLLFFLIITSTYLSQAQQEQPRESKENSLDQKLFTALDNKDIESVKSLLRQGADVNAAYDGVKYSGSKGMSLFVYGMITTNDVDFMRYLMAQGANPKTKVMAREGASAIHYAAEYRMKEMLSFLVDEAGFSINEENTYQKTPLSYAAMMRYPDAEFIQFMIDKGAQVDYPDVNGGTALNWAISYQAFNLVKTLVENGADVNNLSTYGAPYSRFKVNTLSTAISYSNVEIFNYLLSKGADYQYTDRKTSALHMAASWGFPYGVNKLLALGVDKNRKDLDGLTAMQIAMKKDRKFEQQLLLYGASDTDKKLFRLMEDEALKDMKISMGRGGEKKTVVHDLEGNEVLIKKYRGKLTLLNFWATWCGPCLREMPSMKNLKDKMGDKLQIVAVSVDKEKSKIPEFDASHGPYPFIYLHDPEWKLYKEFYSALPGSYLLGKDGKILASISGSYTWDDPKVIELIEVLSQY